MIDQQFEKRAFVRHPLAVPLRCEVLGQSRESGVVVTEAQNMSEIGICFAHEQSLSPGTILRLYLRLLDHDFEILGKVIWASGRLDGRGFDVGAMLFESPQAFKVKMLEQVLAIERYREEMEKEHRHLSKDEAARELIQRYGANI